MDGREMIGLQHTHGRHCEHKMPAYLDSDCEKEQCDGDMYTLFPSDAPMYGCTGDVAQPEPETHFDNTYSDNDGDFMKQPYTYRKRKVHSEDQLEMAPTHDFVYAKPNDFGEQMSSEEQYHARSAETDAQFWSSGESSEYDSEEDDAKQTGNMLREQNMLKPFEWQEDEDIRAAEDAFTGPVEQKKNCKAGHNVFKGSARGELEHNFDTAQGAISGRTPDVLSLGRTRFWRCNTEQKPAALFGPPHGGDTHERPILPAEINPGPRVNTEFQPSIPQQTGTTEKYSHLGTRYYATRKPPKDSNSVVMYPNAGYECQRPPIQGSDIRSGARSRNLAFAQPFPLGSLSVNAPAIGGSTMYGDVVDGSRKIGNTQMPMIGIGPLTDTPVEGTQGDRDAAARGARFCRDGDTHVLPLQTKWDVDIPQAGWPTRSDDMIRGKHCKNYESELQPQLMPSETSLLPVHGWGCVVTGTDVTDSVSVKGGARTRYVDDVRQYFSPAITRNPGRTDMRGKDTNMVEGGRTRHDITRSTQVLIPGAAVGARAMNECKGLGLNRNSPIISTPFRGQGDLGFAGAFAVGTSVINKMRRLWNVFGPGNYGMFNARMNGEQLGGTHVYDDNSICQSALSKQCNVDGDLTPDPSLISQAMEYAPGAKVIRSMSDPENYENTIINS